jgi:hypothetical protein
MACEIPSMIRGSAMAAAIGANRRVDLRKKRAVMQILI